MNQSTQDKIQSNFSRSSLAVYRILTSLLFFYYSNAFFSLLPNHSVFGENIISIPLTNYFNLENFSWWNDIKNFFSFKILLKSFFFRVLLTLSCFFFFIGFYTRLSQSLIFISFILIHNTYGAFLDNSYQVLMPFLFYSFLLPLNQSFCIDSLLKSLKETKDYSVSSLNQKIPSRKLRKNQSAYFLILFQVFMILFFSATNAIFLDIKDIFHIYETISVNPMLSWLLNFFEPSIALTTARFFYQSILFLTFLSILNLISRIFQKRRLHPAFFYIFLTLHITTYMSGYHFTYTLAMISCCSLLFQMNEGNFFFKFLKNQTHSNCIVLYDDNCGFCHQVARIIKRCDAFTRLKWLGNKDYKKFDEKIYQYEKKSIVVIAAGNKDFFIKNQAFSQIIRRLPFGFLVYWVFSFPLLSNLFSYFYDFIAFNRHKISSFLGYSSCFINDTKANIGKDKNLKEISSKETFLNLSSKLQKIIFYTFFLLVLISNVNQAVIKNAFSKRLIPKNERFHNFLSFAALSEIFAMNQEWKYFGKFQSLNEKKYFASISEKNNETTDLLSGEKIMQPLKVIFYDSIPQHKRFFDYYIFYFLQTRVNETHILKKNILNYYQKKHSKFKRAKPDDIIIVELEKKINLRDSKKERKNNTFWVIENFF